MTAGPNLSTIVGDLTETDNPRLGYHFGAFAEIPISKRFSFNPEVLYSSIGTTSNINEDFGGVYVDPNGGIISFKSAQRSNYLTIPLSMKFHFTPNFGLEFGPQVAFLVNSVSKLKEYEGFEPEEERYSSPGDFRLDYGATLGVAFNLNEPMSLRLR